GLSGFISEILVFLGAFNSNLGAHDLGGGVSSMLQISFASMTIISAFGVVLTAAYLVWMMQRVFFGPLNGKYKAYSDLSGRELFTLVPLVIVVIALGIYPRPLIDLTQNSVQVVQQHVLKSQKIEYAERHVGDAPAHAEAKTPENRPAESAAAVTPAT